MGSTDYKQIFKTSWAFEHARGKLQYITQIFENYFRHFVG